MRAVSVTKTLGILILVFAMGYSALALIDPNAAAPQFGCCGTGVGCSTGYVCCNYLRMCEPPCSSIAKNYCTTPSGCVICVKTPRK